MVDKGEGMGIADVSLQGKEEAQHQFRAEAHRGTDIANDHDLGFADLIAEMDIHRNAMMFEVGVDGSLWVELYGLGALLPESDMGLEGSCQPLDVARQNLLIGIRQDVERSVHQVVAVLAGWLLGQVLRQYRSARMKLFRCYLFRCPAMFWAMVLGDI